MINANAEEPRNLTTQMAAQLDAVASYHGGEVPLHGRLFSQWLHYAFPHECPYPQLTHESESHLSTQEYAKRHNDPVFSLEDIDAFIKASDYADQRRLAE